MNELQVIKVMEQTAEALEVMRRADRLNGSDFSREVEAELTRLQYSCEVVYI